MINLIINEYEYAKRLINGSVLDPNPYYALSLISRYYYHNEGFRKKKISILLGRYLVSHYVVEEFEKSDWSEMIDKIAANARKYPIKEIKGISIKVPEMKTIDSISGSALRRLAFTILCLAKLGNARNAKNNGWVNVSSKDVFELANINCSSYEREVKIGALYHKGLLDFPKQNDNLSYRVTFIDENEHDDEALFVDDLRALGYQYLNAHDGGFTRCRECGILIREKDDPHSPGRKRMYCKNCIAPKYNETRELQCIDCGGMFTTSIKNTKSKRCPYCTGVHYREYHKQYMRKRKMNNTF